MKIDRVEHTHEETYCEYCSAPLSKGDRVYWDAGERHPFCSRACAERDLWYVEHVQPGLPPIQSLNDLAGAMVLGLKRDHRAAVVLLERADGAQVALAFSGVSEMISEPAANAHLTAIRQDGATYVFDFSPDTPARLEIQAVSHTLALLS